MMDLGYIEPTMDKKDPEARTPFDPPATRRVKAHTMKWRGDPVLYKKLVTVAAVAACKAEIESGVESEVSVNKQLSFVVQQFLLSYEEEFGKLPEISSLDVEKAKTEAPVKRYAQAALKK